MATIPASRELAQAAEKEDDVSSNPKSEQKEEEKSEQEEIPDVLQLDAYPAFETMLKASMTYANIKGGRYRHKDLETPEKLDKNLAEAVNRMRRSVDHFAAKLRDGDKDTTGVWKDYERVRKDSVIAGVVNAMKVTCESLGVYSNDIQETSSDYTDIENATIPQIGARLFNYKTTMDQDPTYQRKLITASFISDIGEAANAPNVDITAEQAPLLPFMEKARLYEEDIGKPGVVDGLLDDLGTLLEDNLPKDLVENIKTTWEENKESIGIAVGAAVLAGVLYLGKTMVQRKRSKEQRKR